MSFLTPERLASIVRDEEMEGGNSGPVRSIYGHLRATQKEIWGIASNRSLHESKLKPRLERRRK